MTEIDQRRLANLLGAAALGLADRVQAAAERATGLGASVPAALLHVHAEPGGTAERLRQALGLSQPGTVDLVRRLVDTGLVHRTRGVDRRSSALRLTAAGSEAVARLHQQRGALLGDLVAGLDADERDALDRVLPALLAQLTRSADDLRRICRLCDVAGCEAGGPCPVAEAAGAHRPA